MPIAAQTTTRPPLFRDSGLNRTIDSSTPHIQLDRAAISTTPDSRPNRTASSTSLSSRLNPAASSTTPPSSPNRTAS